MTLKQLATLVAEMRHAQKAYFASRSADGSRSTQLLNASKAKEKAVDTALKDILNPSSRPLFGSDEGL